MADPKALAAMLVAGKKESSAPVEPDADDSSDGSEGAEAAGTDIMDAIKSGDVGALVSALKAFMEVSG